MSVGSSLRVRGTERRRLRPRPPERVIPACAGNSRETRRPARPTTGHPCVCGEQDRPPDGLARADVSSLRVRGTVPVDRIQRADVRVIPACAGNRRRAPTNSSV